MLQRTFKMVKLGDQYLLGKTVFSWYKLFEENIEKIRDEIIENRHLTIKAC